MKNIIVDFEGWVEIDPTVVKFNYIGQESLTIWKEIITGVEWQKLSEENRSEYILESVIDAQRDCLDGSYGTIDISLARLN